MKYIIIALALSLGGCNLESSQSAEQIKHTCFNMFPVESEHDACLVGALLGECSLPNAQGFKQCQPYIQMMEGKPHAQ